MAKPIRSYKLGSIELAVWAGDKGESYSIQKSYKDSAGKWVQTNFFFASEMPIVQALVARAVGEMNMVRAAVGTQGSAPGRAAANDPLNFEPLGDDEVPF